MKYENEIKLTKCLISKIIWLVVVNVCAPEISLVQVS